MEEGQRKKISDDESVGSEREMMIIIDANEKSWPWSLLSFSFGFSTRAGDALLCLALARMIDSDVSIFFFSG